MSIRISPFGGNRKITEEKQKEMRKHVEATLVDLRARATLQSGDIQRTIEDIRRIDSREPVDQYARKRACGFLKMYLGQYRVLQAMRDNMEAIYSELEMREMTQDFAQSVEELSMLIKGFEWKQKSPAGLIARLRKVMQPINDGKRMSEYDAMYDELMRMYPAEKNSNSADSISDSWLEDIVAGRADWNSAPVLEENPIPETTQNESIYDQSKRSDNDIRNALSSITNALRGERK